MRRSSLHLNRACMAHECVHTSPKQKQKHKTHINKTQHERMDKSTNQRVMVFNRTNQRMKSDTRTMHGFQMSKQQFSKLGPRPWMPINDTRGWLLCKPTTIVEKHSKHHKQYYTPNKLIGLTDSQSVTAKTCDDRSRDKRIIWANNRMYSEHTRNMVLATRGSPPWLVKRMC